MFIDRLKKHLPTVSTMLIVLTGVAFILAAVIILITGGDRPYTREIVGDYLVFLTIPSLITTASLIASAVLLPSDRGELTSYTDIRATARKLSRTLSLPFAGEEMREKILGQRRKRGIYLLILTVTELVLSVFLLIYLAFIAEFTQERLNLDVISALLVVLPVSVVGLGTYYILTRKSEESYNTEIALIKEAIKAGAIDSEKKGEESSKIVSLIKKNEDTILICVRSLILVLGVVFIILGVSNGGAADVLGKAIRICTECIGLG